MLEADNQRLRDEGRGAVDLRNTRGTRLTAAGEALLDDARTLLPAADAAQRRVRDAAGQRTFTVGFAPGVIITLAVRELSRRHPEVSAEVFRSD